MPNPDDWKHLFPRDPASPTQSPPYECVRVDEHEVKSIDSLLPCDTEAVTGHDAFRRIQLDDYTNETSKPKSFAKQVAGHHYTDLAMQPMEYSMRNKLDPCQHTAIKYITRFKDDGGAVDLDKAAHCIEMLKDFYYNNKD